MARPLALLSLGAFVLLPATALAVTATFDDLATPPPLNEATGLQFAHGSLTYQGVIWDSRFRVVGDEYKVDSPAGPLFGLPKSGHYFVTNEPGVTGSGFHNDGLVLATTLVLTEVWFGQNEFYGFGGGADEVTVHALSGSSIIGSVTMTLSEDHPGQPEPLQKMDTSEFLSLTGITGYRIDRHAAAEFSDTWVADDFVFQSPVPESASVLTFGAGLALLVAGKVARRGSAGGQSGSSSG